MSQNIELKAYKMLSKIRGNMLSRIQHEARNKIEYCKNDSEEFQKWVGYIGDPSKWDYCGLLSKEDKEVLETLEYLLDDNMTEIRRY